MDISKQEEKNLVEKTMQDIAHFSDLYELYQEKIYNYCYYRIYNEELACDFTGDVFMKAIEAMQNGKYSWDDRVGFGGWLYRIAHNRIVDHYKKASTKREILLDEKIDKAFEADAHELDEKIDTQNALTDVYKFIADFDDQTQSLFVLKFSEEHTFSEIADILELNESTVKMKYYRAIEHIKKQLSLVNS